MQEIVCHPDEKQAKGFTTEMSASCHRAGPSLQAKVDVSRRQRTTEPPKTNSSHFLLTMSFITILRYHKEAVEVSRKMMSACVTVRIIRLKYNCSI